MNASSIKETITERSYSLESENGDSLEIRRIQRNLYEFCRFKIDEANQSFKAVAGRRLFNYCKSNSIVLSTDDMEYDRPIVRLLENCGFKITYSKMLFEKNLKEHEFLFKDIFEYESIAETGLKQFLEVFKEVVNDDPERDVAYEVYFSDLVEYAEEKYEPKNWKTVMLERRYIGVMLPQIFPDKEEWGGVFYIGLIPEARNKGYGRIMLSKCMEILKGQGIKRYIGSTNTNNEPMLRVFESTGCKEMFKRFIYSTS